MIGDRAVLKLLNSIYEALGTSNLENIESINSSILNAISILTTTVGESSGGGSTTSSEYNSPVDFNAVYLSTGSVTISGNPSITNSSQVTHVLAINTSAKTTTTYTQGVGGYMLYHSSDEVSIYKDGSIITDLNSNMVFLVGLNMQRKGYDAGQNATRVSVINPLPDTYLPVQNIIDVAQDVTGSFIVLGGVAISCRGYKTARNVLNIDINDTIDFRFQVLIVYTDTTMEVACNPNKWALTRSTLSSDQTYRELDSDSDALYELIIELDNTVDSYKIMISAGTVGATAGQVDAAQYRLGY